MDEQGLMTDKEFRLGYDNQLDPKIMVVNIPIQLCADDKENGTALLRGKVEEIKQIALALINRKRKKSELISQPLNVNS